MGLSYDKAKVQEDKNRQVVRTINPDLWEYTRLYCENRKEKQIERDSKNGYELPLRVETESVKEDTVQKGLDGIVQDVVIDSKVQTDKNNGDIKRDMNIPTHTKTGENIPSLDYVNHPSRRDRLRELALALKIARSENEVKTKISNCSRDDKQAVWTHLLEGSERTRLNKLLEAS